jgi:ABC-type oligopeptide transport system substrate-binding subunit
MPGREVQISPEPLCQPGRLRLSACALLAVSAWLVSCTNNPQPSGLQATNTLFSAFSERSPRYLDPTASYSNNETPVTYQVYEPLYGYDYLKRPYTPPPSWPPSTSTRPASRWPTTLQRN